MDDYEAEFHIGSVKVWLKSLAYMIEMKEQLEITNFSGQEVGLLNVSVIRLCVRSERVGEQGGGGRGRVGGTCPLLERES